MSAPIDDGKPPPNHQCDVLTAVRFSFWLSGLLTTVVGFVFIAEIFENQPRCQGPDCIGPALRKGDWIDTKLNQNWRDVFSLRPNLLVLNWTAVFFGLVTMLCHLQGFNYSLVSSSWIHVGIWLFFLSLFGNFAYAGNLGIIVGFFTLGVCIACFAMYFTKHQKERTTLHVPPGIFARFACLADNEVVYQIARMGGFLIGWVTIAIGCIHVFQSDFRWCPAPTYNECIGPSLRWSSGNFVADANDNLAWRSIFTFQPEIFGPLWGPVFLGWVTILQHFRGKTWNFLYGNWAKVCIWFLFIGCFANFGYSGFLGVVVGFASIIEAFLAFAIAVSGGHHTLTHFEIEIRGFNDKR